MRLGPVSTLQPYNGGLVLRADFFNGDVPELPSGWFARASRQSFIRQDGSIGFVEPNEPALTWRGDAYALAAEPAATNQWTLAMKSAAAWTGGIRATGIDDPAGGNQSVRVSGGAFAHGQPSPTNAIFNGSTQTIRCIVRKAGTNPSFYMTPRNSTKAAAVTPYPYINLDTGAFESGNGRVSFTHRKLANGYVEVSATIDMSKGTWPTAWENGDIVGWYLGYTGQDQSNPNYWFDFYDSHCTALPFDTSLIPLGETQQTRAAPTISIPVAALWDVNVGGALFADFEWLTSSSSVGWPAIGMYFNDPNRCLFYPPPYNNGLQTMSAISFVATTSSPAPQIVGNLGHAGRARAASSQVVGSARRTAINGTLGSVGGVTAAAPAYTRLVVNPFNSAAIYVRNIRLYNRNIDIAKATAL